MMLIFVDKDGDNLMKGKFIMILINLLMTNDNV